MACLSRQAGQRPCGASVVSGVRHSRQIRTVSMFILSLDFHPALRDYRRIRSERLQENLRESPLRIGSKIIRGPLIVVVPLDVSVDKRRVAAAVMMPLWTI